MKKALSWILVFSMLFCLSACASGEKEQEYGLKLQKIYNGEEVTIESDLVSGYMKLTDEAEVAAYLQQYSSKKGDRQQVIFAWEGDGYSRTYTITFSETEDFSNPMVFKGVAPPLTTFGFFEPGKTYWYKVESDTTTSVSQVDHFKVKDNQVRYISLDEAYNIRDLGGWKTEDGKTVKYGMLFRGGTINNRGGAEGLSDRDHYIFEDILGVKCEIDLRTQNGDDRNQSYSVFGYSCNYAKLAIQGYSYILPGFETTYEDDEGKVIRREYYKQLSDNVGKVFEVLGHESNYPAYFHCNAGADRTGTVAFLINGLLGVSYDDLIRDFELTSFSRYGARWRSDIVDGRFTEDGIMQNDYGNFVAIGAMADKLLADYGTGDGKLSSAIENYLKTVCGVSQEEIDTVRRMMLEE